MCAFAVIFAAPAAHARAASDLPYTVADAFSTALRFVRIDRGCKITDKDGESAFVTFECVEDEKTRRGSLEIFKSGGGVRVQVTLGDDPHYLELRFLELYERKLRDERGTPPPVTRRPLPLPDAGT